MNIIAIMGPHGVFYKDEPIKEWSRRWWRKAFRLSGHKTALIC